MIYKTLHFTLLFLASIFSYSQVNPNEHIVNGYTTKSGKVVESYYRTNRNSTNIDNFSTMPNINPHTGKMGTILPEEKYYIPQEPIYLLNYNEQFELNTYKTNEQTNFNYYNNDLKLNDINNNEIVQYENYNEEENIFNSEYSSNTNKINFVKTDIQNNNKINSENIKKTNTSKEHANNYKYSFFEIIIGGISYLFGIVLLFYIVYSIYLTHFT